MVNKKYIEEIIEKKKREVKVQKKEKKRLKRLGQRPKVPKGEIDYKWCNVENKIPRIKTIYNQNMEVLERYSGKRKVI